MTDRLYATAHLRLGFVWNEDSSVVKWIGELFKKAQSLRLSITQNFYFSRLKTDPFFCKLINHPIVDASHN